MTCRETPRPSKEFRRTLVEFVMANLPVLIDAEGPIDIFFVELFVLIDDEAEWILLEDRGRRLRQSNN